MKTQWNTVTPLSKSIALILFVALPFAGFYFGIQYGEALQAAGGGPSAISSAPSQAGSINPYYEDAAAWQVDVHDDSQFSIAYPLDFAIDDSHVQTPSTDWRLNSPNVNGVKVLTITVPSAFEPQTNFADARLTVGYSGNATALTQCLKDDASGGPIQASSTEVINGVHFVVFYSSDAGAGNMYETTSYRTLHNGLCYAVEYTIHSSQIANYPAQYGLKPLNKAPLKDVLDRMVGTFMFL